VDAYPNRTFYGMVLQVRNSPTTVNNVVTYDCVIGVTNSDYKLKPGMTANVSIVVAQRDSVLAVPNAAVRFRVPDSALVLTNTGAKQASSAATNGNFAGVAGGPRSGGRAHGERPIFHTVYILVGKGDEAKLQAVQIRTGVSDGISTEVLSGLDEGMLVVTGVTSSGPQAGGRPTTPFGGFPRMR